MLDQAIRRISLSADMHSCLNSPALFDREFSAILSDAVETAIDSHFTYVSFEVDELDLSFDQISVITMIIMKSTTMPRSMCSAQPEGVSWSRLEPCQTLARRYR